LGCKVVFLNLEKLNDDVKNLGHWVLGDARTLPFRESIFTQVIASHVIEHLEDPLKFLGECRRILKAGGSLDIYTPNFTSKNALTDPDHRNVFNILAFLRIARKTGFKVRFPIHVGTRLPSNLQRILNLAINMLLDEIHVKLIKL